MRWKTLILVFSLFLTMGLCFSVGLAKASSKYMIKINKLQNTVTIYEDVDGEYVPCKAFICSTGDNTPVGTFYLQERYRWHALVQSMYGQYCVRITGHILFHSVPYSSANPSKMFSKEFNKLGVKASHGCIRLTAKDSRWIYKNCPRGTKVVIYNGKNPGPIGKPAMIKIPTKETYSYDPTDKWSSSNPFNGKKPKITGAKNKTVEWGSDIYDLKKGIKVVNSVGKNAKKLLKIKIKYKANELSSYKKVKAIDTEKAGKYRITYQVTDELERSAKVVVTHTVLPEEKENVTPTASPSPKPSGSPMPSAKPTASPVSSPLASPLASPTATPGKTSILGVFNFYKQLTSIMNEILIGGI